MEVNMSKSIIGNNPGIFVKCVFQTWQGIIMEI
jgi:hypothetical protein